MNKIRSLIICDCHVPLHCLINPITRQTFRKHAGLEPVSIKKKRITVRETWPRSDDQLSFWQLQACEIVSSPSFDEFRQNRNHLEEEQETQNRSQRSTGQVKAVPSISSLYGYRRSGAVTVSFVPSKTHGSLPV